MSTSILNLQPANVWKHFHALTQIPRPSGNRTAIVAFIENFGKSLGLETLKDKEGNVVIRKPATPGMENKKTIILQGHLDMVPQKNSDKVFDFNTDPIETIVDGEWVKANGTTLGADNGIGVAATMAILEATHLKHGPIEGLFTVDEETGMYGAFEVRPGFINGNIMLNLDSELDGELYVGCAGGEDVNISFPYEEEAFTPSETDFAIKLSLTGLKGGHSGVDIHLGRANANKLMFRFLNQVMDNFDYVRLASIDGGSLRNAIPREAFAVIVVDCEETRDQIINMAAEYQDLYTTEYLRIEDNISFKAEVIDFAPGLSLIPEDVQDNLILSINGCNNGVSNYFADFPDTVETSSNLAIVKSGNGIIECKVLARSASMSKKEALCSSIESIFLLAGADVEVANGYPGWDPDINSPILKVMKEVCKKQRGVEPEVKVMHAGLECGIILSNVPGLDTISFGPTIRFPHSPDEKVEIATVQRFWDYLVEILEQAPEL